MRNIKTALTYDDITLCPSFSEIESRQNINLETQLTTNYKLMVPLIASPMDTVCESEMAIAMARLGGVGCIHRFLTIEHQAEEVQNVKFAVYGDGFGGIYDDWNFDVPIMAAVGANGDYLERAQELTNAGANVILIDVAHGYHIFVRDAIKALRVSLPSRVDIIAGNIATSEAAIALEDWGASGLRVGIGGGSLCTTRIKTGFGVPNVTSLEDVSSVAKVPIIACGGIKSSGDIAKALAVGADSVILGSLIAGTKETPGLIVEKSNGLYKRYRGAASLETKNVHGQAARNVEGESTLVPFKGSVKFVVDQLLDGVRSALSYAGASSISEFHPDYVVVTSAGVREAHPHLIN
jgi:IMP dehydrogenase